MVSQRPRAARHRIRKAVERADMARENIHRDIEIVYKKPVADWDWEELTRGRPRGADGKFSGSKPSWITPVVHAEAQRRMRTFAEEELMTYARDAIKCLVGLMKDEDVDLNGRPVVPANVRSDAAKYILNHVIGTPRARVEIEASNPMAELMGDILVNEDGTASHQIIEGEVVEDEDDEGDGGE